MRHVERKPERPLRRRRGVLAAGALLGLAPVVVLLGAAGYERVRSFTASELLTPAQLKGAHHRVAVPTEGYLHVFSVSTDWGESSST